MELTKEQKFKFRLRMEREREAEAVAQTTLEEPGFLDTMSNAADKITSTIPAVAGLMAPTLGMAQYAGQKMNEASGGLAEATTELAGRHGVPGVGAAALGVGAGILSNPMTYVNPGAVAGGKFFKPVAPSGRQAAVSAGERIGMPLRRGEVTGSKISTGLSNFMEKTVLGSGPEDAFTARQYGALNAEKQRLQGKIGNAGDTYAVGQKAQTKIAGRDAAMAAQKNQMFESIPDNVTIPLQKARSVADTIIQEQSQYLPTTRNADVIAISKDVQSAEQALSGGVSNFQQLKRLREVVGSKAQDAKSSGKFAEARDYQRLKHAIDDDINSFVGGQTRPMESLVADEFSKSYRKANAYSGAYKGLFKSDEAKALVGADPNKVVDMVFKGKNNETSIKQFRALSGEEGFLPAKQTFTKELLDSPNLLKELENYEEGHLRAIYSGPELTELRQYAQAQTLPKTTTNLQATQGSARSNIAAGQYTGLGAGLLSLLTGNVAGAAIGIGQFAAPAAVSRLNLHLAGGVPYSFGAGSANAMKFVGGAALSGRKDRLSEYIDRIVIKDGSR